MITTFARNRMLDAIGVTHVSAHTAYSSTGASEVTGGTPAYARKAITYGAASAEAKSATTQPVLDIPAGTTVRFIGLWDALTAGNFLGMIPNGGTEQEFAVDTTASTVKVPAHGWAATQKIVFIGDTPPAPLVEGTVYFVAGTVTTNTFQVSATSGGATITLTAEPGRKCTVAAIVEEAFASQGTLTVSSQVVRLDA